MPIAIPLTTMTKEVWMMAQKQMAKCGITTPSWANLGADRRIELIAALRVSRDDFDALVIRYFIYPNL